jgi:outer membrane receptor protein involved in Fe transport
VRYIHSFLEELRTPENERSRTQSTADQLLKVQWNLKESHVLTLQVLHNAEYFGNSGLSLVRPLEATTNALKRGTTIGLSERRTAGRKLLETTLQWTNNHESDLAKGNRLLEIHPHLWSGHYHTDQRGRVRRFHAAETITWDRRGDRLDHRIKAGGEFDWVDSNVHLERRPFALFNEYDDLKSLVSFDGATVSGIRNQEYGAFVQDRLTLGPRLQVELGLRYDRERVTGLNNLGPRASFSFLPFGTSESKVSGGIGRFYDNIALLSLQMPRLQRRYTTVYSGGNPVTTPMATDVRVDSALRNPNGLHWNLAWENEWAPRWVTRIAYFEKTGRDQVRLAAVTNVSGFDMVFNNSGQSHYRALEISLDRAIRTDIRFLASYIYSKATARPSLWLDFPDPSVEYLGEAPVEWNIPHRFVGWGYFPLPSGFSASFSVEARSGFPFTVIDDMHQLAEGYNRRQLPVYFATNASVEKQIPIPLGKGKRVAFRVGVTNLFNRFNPRYVDQNINSPYFLSLADSSQRHFSARIRILKK